MPHFPSRPLSTTSTPPTQNFTYRLAAASSAKRHPPRAAKPQTDFWTYSSTTRKPSPPYLRSTKIDSGEDAFFATTIASSPHDVAFGVADGVGGWQDQGVDPSDFSHGLCGLMAGTAHIHEVDGRGPVRPQWLLQTAYDAVMANPRIMAGGSTATVATLDGEGEMETANLGDSGYLIFGPGKVAYRSAVQTHAFNTPFQMSKVPPKMQAQHAIFGGSTHFSETPAQADVVRHKVRHGDVVVVATDGVWDNLSAQDTLSIVTRVMQEGGYWSTGDKETLLNNTSISSIDVEEHEKYLPALVATAIMREAKMAGLDRKRNGPFAKEVNYHYPAEGWSGGKPDDIAVVVCVAVDGGVGKQEEEQPPVRAKL
ncbi:Protein phosphatase 2C 7 [Vermiconidia calcicola]|uniref:Protein phosphatase 2C 7 n=1 Tax=Vermiconidia calcicola TaxID=1690605 RepID=A0ACC3NBU1_9PEZI|nr:Protein phosphatase 2C 7 [Vermiconidia calcicola]